MKYIGNYALTYGSSQAQNILSKGFFGTGGSWGLNFFQCEKCGYIAMFDTKQNPELPEPT